MFYCRLACVSSDMYGLRLMCVCSIWCMRSSPSSSGFFVPVATGGDEALPDTHSTADTVDNEDTPSTSLPRPRPPSRPPPHKHTLNSTAPAAYTQRRMGPEQEQEQEWGGYGKTAPGHTTATVRALKELARHEQFVNSAVQEMYRWELWVVYHVLYIMYSKL
jgi:hypothetical protein